MDKVLVVKAIEPNFNTMGGPPVMMVGGGGRSRDGPAVGRTKREVAGGVAGGLVGVAGALAGQHRSLGSLAQAMISGGAQGKALGGAFGRSKLALVGRQRQARADYDEEAKRDYARMGAEGRFDNRKYDVNDRMNPATKRRRVQEVNEEDASAKEQSRRDNAYEQARAGAAGRDFGEEQVNNDKAYREMRENLQGLSREEQNAVFNRFNQAAKDRFGNADYVDVEPSTQGSDMTAVTPSSQQLGGGENRQPGMVAVAGEPTQGAGSIVPLGADNKPPMMPIPPLATPPAGSVGSGNETADREGQGINDTQGFNFKTENEPGDNMKPTTLADAMQEDEKKDPSRQVGVVDNRQPPQGNQETLPSSLGVAVRQDMGQEM